MKLVFFKKPETRKFNYKPRYYDVEKEEREQRRKELGLGDDSGKLMRGDLQAKWRRDRSNLKTEKKGFRSTMYLVLLLFFVYIIFFTDFVQNMVSSLLR